MIASTNNIKTVTPTFLIIPFQTRNSQKSPQNHKNASHQEKPNDFPGNLPENHLKSPITGNNYICINNIPILNYSGVSTH